MFNYSTKIRAWRVYFPLGAKEVGLQLAPRASIPLKPSVLGTSRKNNGESEKGFAVSSAERFRGFSDDSFRQYS